MKQETGITPEIQQASETDQTAFVAGVGQRVRAARRKLGISRRELSEASSVSQRYLAQLEGGEGNISIALLYRVAKALDVQADTLLSQDVIDGAGTETRHFVSLFDKAEPRLRAQVMALLDPENKFRIPHQRICLIGLRGAGKSTLGTMVSESLGMPFRELNEDIEEQAGMPVTEVMALYGQEGYRQLERDALENIVENDNRILVAAAGGIVAEPETFAYLLANFRTVWIKAQPEEHMERVRRQGDERPMAGNPRAMDDLKSILTSREELYARADAVLDTSGRHPAECAEELAGLLQSALR